MYSLRLRLLPILEPQRHNVATGVLNVVALWYAAGRGRCVSWDLPGRRGPRHRRLGGVNEEGVGKETDRRAARLVWGTLGGVAGRLGWQQALRADVFRHWGCLQPAVGGVVVAPRRAPDAAGLRRAVGPPVGLARRQHVPWQSYAAEAWDTAGRGGANVLCGPLGAVGRAGGRGGKGAGSLDINLPGGVEGRVGHQHNATTPPSPAVGP
mmetsp:Transcript_29480/g.83149  ORF Transcript_29480/g.83149 Transcript_29480/m.83149 type:complete len:209 (-) Transcript_29480:1998-2624(-)